MNFLITWAAGFLGSALANHLSREGLSLAAIVAGGIFQSATAASDTWATAVSGDWNTAAK